MPPTRGPRVVRWIESNLVHAEGDYFGRPFRLTREQKAFIYRCYEQHPDARRRYRRVLRGRPKGYGKTELVAAIACYELGGGDVEAPIIPVGAASFEQADLLFGAARVMISEGPLKPFFDVFDTEILVKHGPGRMYRVAAAAGTNDGQLPTFVVADELHEWAGAKERVHLVLSNGLTKRRDSWGLNISTAGADAGVPRWEPATLLGKLYCHGRRVASGEIDDPTFLFDWLEARDGFDLSTREGWLAAVRSLDPPPWVDVDVVVGRCLEIPEFEARRYYLNQWTAVTESWLPAGTWEGLRVEPFELAAEGPMFVGVDAATKHDSTAIVFTQWLRGRLHVRSRIWERPAGPDGKPAEGWKLPIAEVENVLRDAHRTYRLRGVGYDPALFERSAQQLEAEGLPMIEIPQSDARMVPACQKTYQLAVEGKLAHDGDPVLARHIASAAAVEARNGGWRLRKGNAKAKMDGAIALTLGVLLASDPPTVPIVPSVEFV